MRGWLSDWLQLFSLRLACALTGHVWTPTDAGTRVCGICGDTRTN